jgi:type VI secretion system protein ImpE
MSAAEDRFRAGDLSGALTELQAEVRKNPSAARLRVFLSQLLMLTGDWDRALNQLTVVAELDAGALPMVHAYRSAIQCERLRAAVFAGERSPLIFGDPEPWIAQLLQALTLLGQNRPAEASALREQALNDAPATGGTLDGTAFEWIADADSRIGPLLEVLLQGAYYWVPFSRISRIVIEPPADARDLAWLPAQFTWSNGGEAMGMIPTRYPGSEHSDDDAIRVSRKTQWREIGPDAYAGLGQRLLVTSADERGLLEIRELTLQAG